MEVAFNVLSMTGQKIPIDCLGEDNTVLDLKTKLEQIEGVPRNLVALEHGGRRLEDQYTLYRAGIKTGGTVRMIVSPDSFSHCSDAYWR